MVVATVGALLAVGAALANVDPTIPDLIILGTALAVGELFELRPTGRAPLPLSFAVVVVLVRAATHEQFTAIVVLAFLVGVALRSEPKGVMARLLLYFERICEALAAGIVYHLVVTTDSSTDTRATVLVALAAAAIVQVVIADSVVAIQTHRVASIRARGADLALVTSAVLMAVGYGGIDGEGHLGLWGPLLFSIPLVAAWYSFELLASTRRSFQQTVRSLGQAPELGGLVRVGHVDRVAGLAVAMGEELDLSDVELEHLETAAFLHHFGSVCLDEPPEGGHLDPVAVADASAAMLRGSEALAPAGDIVAAEPALHRESGKANRSSSSLSGQILKVASAFDELTDGNEEHTAWALAALFTGPLYVYDGRVVGALERVLERRGLPVARV